MRRSLALQNSLPFRQHARESIALAIALASGCFVCAHASEAQETDGKNAKPVVEEVVVTARNRTELAQEVPIPISVIGGGQLERDRKSVV